jgi:hypothetical protein
VCPRLSRVCRLVHAIASGEIGADDSCATSHIYDVRIRRSYRDSTDRTRWLVVKYRVPRGSIVGRTPNATVVESSVKHVGLARYTVDRPSARAASGAN